MKLLRKLVTVVVLLAMLGIGTLFALQNREPVALDLLVYTFAPQSLALWLLGAFALGGILGMLASSAIILRMRTSLGSSKRQLNRAQGELNKLRAETPVTP